MFYGEWKIIEKPLCVAYVFGYLQETLKSYDLFNTAVKEGTVPLDKM